MIGNKKMNNDNSNIPKTYSEKITLYQTLLNRRQHIENIFWSRIQTLHLIQAAVLGGGYFLGRIEGEIVLSVALLLIGLLLTVLLGYLACNDWNDARVNDKKMYTLDELGIRRTANRDCLRSHSILFCAIILFLVIDIGFILWLMVKTVSSTC